MGSWTERDAAVLKRDSIMEIMQLLNGRTNQWTPSSSVRKVPRRLSTERVEFLSHWGFATARQQQYEADILVNVSSHSFLCLMSHAPEIMFLFVCLLGFLTRNEFLPWWRSRRSRRGPQARNRRVPHPSTWPASFTSWVWLINHQPCFKRCTRRTDRSSTDQMDHQIYQIYQIDHVQIGEIDHLLYIIYIIYII